MDLLREISHIPHVMMRDFYYSAKPYFGAVFVAIICLAMLVFLHRTYGENLRSLLRGLIQELEAASRNERQPSALNFLFGVLLMALVLLIVLGSEASEQIRGFFLKEVYDPTLGTARIVIPALLVLFLGVFFIWSISLSRKYHRKS